MHYNYVKQLKGPLLRSRTRVNNASVVCSHLYGRPSVVFLAAKLALGGQ